MAEEEVADVKKQTVLRVNVARAGAKNNFARPNVTRAVGRTLSARWYLRQDQVMCVRKLLKFEYETMRELQPFVCVCVLCNEYCYVI